MFRNLGDWDALQTIMDISQGKVFSSLLLFLLFIVDLGEGHNRCPQLWCGEDGPSIQFPFQLKDKVVVVAWRRMPEAGGHRL